MKEKKWQKRDDDDTTGLQRKRPADQSFNYTHTLNNRRAAAEHRNEARERERERETERERESVWER